jgi:chromosome partitioning protein
VFRSGLAHKPEGAFMANRNLVGVSEIAGMADPPVTKQAVANWRHRFDDFPKPVQTLQNGPVWDEEVISEWLQARSGRAPVVISFINLKGGVAKTTTSVAVAEMLAKEHRKHVLFIDLDPQTNATINLIGEETWQEQNEKDQTLAQLFKDKLRPELKPKFDIAQAIVHGVSKIDGGIARLDLLPSSIEFIEIQEKLPFVAMHGNYDVNPQDILRKALMPVIDRYDFVIIDCPPSLGIVTKNGLRFSTHYVIPTIPDIVSTWGIFQIVSNIASFAESINRKIKPMGIVATKVQGNSLHSRIMADLGKGRLFDGKDTELKQPPLFQNNIPQTVDTSRGADFEANVNTFHKKYGSACEPQISLTKEILVKCGQLKS